MAHLADLEHWPPLEPPLVCELQADIWPLMEAAVSVHLLTLHTRQLKATCERFLRERSGLGEVAPTTSHLVQQCEISYIKIEKFTLYTLSEKAIPVRIDLLGSCYISHGVSISFSDISRISTLRSYAI
ncbi:hypothetical protein CRG98_012974 [Punica granatum]|uniref:Uncharacterized protein n=1 Tax=Punica granatum TaxID=22663 RepID=A0A2I0KDP7_PUNGR|nr:hypothetical protein CRG98_012974 [Punica granatum]